jgi:YjbE family integral membrane protein
VISAAADAARLLEIVGMNIMLSGDNAVVVGMTVRNLRGTQRRVAAAAGVVIAMLLQAAATLTVAELLRLPIVSLAGGLLLCVIGIRLLRDNGSVPQLALPYRVSDGPFASMLKVIGIYLVMSPDNILAIAAVGRGHPWLLSAGLLLSSAVIIPASLIIADLMKRYPIILTAGAGVVGWVAGSMLEGALHLDQILNGQVARFFIPAMITVAVLTSPLWYRFGNRTMQSIRDDCK